MSREIRELGYIIDESLQFTSHINQPLPKLIRKCFVLIDVLMLIGAIKTMSIRSILEYASCVWSPTYTTARAH